MGCTSSDAPRASPHLSLVWFSFVGKKTLWLLSLKGCCISSVCAGEPGERELHCAMGGPGAMAGTRQDTSGPEDG